MLISVNSYGSLGNLIFLPMDHHVYINDIYSVAYIKAINFVTSSQFNTKPSTPDYRKIKKYLHFIFKKEVDEELQKIEAKYQNKIVIIIGKLLFKIDCIAYYYFVEIEDIERAFISTILESIKLIKSDNLENIIKNSKTVDINLLLKGYNISINTNLNSFKKKYKRERLKAMFKYKVINFYDLSKLLSDRLL